MDGLDKFGYFERQQNSYARKKYSYRKPTQGPSDFLSDSYPIEPKLALKKGNQIRFTHKEKRSNHRRGTYFVIISNDSVNGVPTFRFGFKNP